MIPQVTVADRILGDLHRGDRVRRSTGKEPDPDDHGRTATAGFARTRGAGRHTEDEID